MIVQPDTYGDNVVELEPSRLLEIYNRIALNIQGSGRQKNNMSNRRIVKIRDRSNADLEDVVLQYASMHPEFGQARVARELKKTGYFISASGVRYIWKRHELETTYKRLKAIEKSRKRGAINFTAEQQAVLERGDSSLKLTRKLKRDSRGDNEAGSVQRIDQILNAAAELFSLRGYDGTSIRDIARQVGLLPGSVYHYFPSKEDLFVSLNHTGFSNLIEKVEQAVKGSSDPWQRLELACVAHIELIIAGDGIDRVTGSTLFSYHEQRLLRRLKGDRDRYEGIFARLVAELYLAPGADRSLFRMFLLGVLNWTRVWYRPGKRTPKEIAREIVATLRGQYAARADNQKGRRTSAVA